MIENKIKSLKTNIVNEPSFNQYATKKALMILNDIENVLNRQLGKVTGNAPKNLMSNFSNNFGNKSFTGSLAKGKVSVYNEIGDLQNEIVVNRIIPNNITQWAVNKLNTIKRL